MMFRLYGLFGLVIATAAMVQAALPLRRLAEASTTPVAASLTLADLTRASEPAKLSDFIAQHVQLPPGNLSNEELCLAQAVYFEARSEPLEGQLAVAQVVLNRVADKRFPDSNCKVVFQNETRRHRCQFSFACDGRSDQPYERRAWTVAQKVSIVATAGEWRDLAQQATHYHAEYVQPYWRGQMARTAQYGQHVFYRERGP